MIRSSTGSPAFAAKGKASGWCVTYIPYGPSVETPDEGGTNGRLRGDRASRPLKALEKFNHLRCQIRVVVDDLPAIGFPAVDIRDPMLDGNIATG
jgi:hypothetical protein